jgi:hypothetical protein
MSDRFYVNDVQIFGNNEMFPKTYEELKKQGAKWTEDGTFCEIEITDPQALMDAVEQDTFEYLKKITTEDILDKKTLKFYDRDFKDVHDKELILNEDFEDDFKYNCYDLQTGEIEKNIWERIGWWIDSRRAFTSYNLYMAIRYDVEFKEGKLVLKEGHSITAHMY